MHGVFSFLYREVRVLHGLSNDALYSAIQIKSIFFRESTGETASVDGTGFFVHNKHKKFCLLTNRHVLDFGYKTKDYRKTSGFSLEKIEITAFASDEDASPREMPRVRITGTLDGDKNSVMFSSDYENDVAVMVDPRFRFDRQDVRFDYFVGHGLLANEAWISEKISVCDFVAFPGFPPWHDKAEGRPIFRTGSISSDPRSKYSYSGEPEGDRVAYEAFSFGGSSGSPVFSFRKSGVEANTFTEVRLIGINAGHLNHEYMQHSGISFFYKSSVILEMIDGIPSQANGDGD
jgi:hypothetical protein